MSILSLGEDYLFSRFVSIYRKGSCYLYLNHLTGESLILAVSPQRIKHIFRKTHFSREEHIILKQLENKHFLFTSSEVQNYLATKSGEVLHQSQKIDTLYLVLSTVCNLDCSYCFLRPNQKGISRERIAQARASQIMKFTTARRALDFFVQLLTCSSEKLNDYYLIFYGGEPLLAQATLSRILPYLRKLQKLQKLPFQNLHLLLDTNGTLLSDKEIKMCQEYQIEVTLALDGPQLIHDYYRREKGKGTYQVVINNLKLLQKAKVKVYLSLALTPLLLETSVIDLTNLIAQLKIKEIGLNVLRGSSLVKFLGGEREWLVYQKRAANFVIQLEKQLDQKTQIECFPIWRKKYFFLNQKFLFTNCGALGEQIAVFPDGSLGICPWEPKMVFGNLLDNTAGSFLNKFTTYLQSSKAQEMIKEAIPLLRQECLACEALSICGGDCPLNVAPFKCQPYLQQVSANCFISRSLVPSLIENQLLKGRPQK